MDASFRKNRRTTVHSVDVDATLHGSCSNCHHWYNGSEIQLHLSPDGSFQNRIICPICHDENFAIGGRQSRLSFLPQLTLRPDASGDQLSGGRSAATLNGQPASSWMLRIRGLMSPPMADSTSATYEQSPSSDRACNTLTVDTRSAQPGQVFESPIASPADSTCAVRPSTSVESSHSRTKGDNIDSESPPGSPLRRAISKARQSAQRALAGIKRSSRQPSFKMASGRPSTDGAPRSSTSGRAAGASHETSVRPVVLVEDRRQAEGQPRATTRRIKLCHDCEAFIHAERQRLTVEKVEQALAECPRMCCRRPAVESTSEDLSSWGDGSGMNEVDLPQGTVLVRDAGGWAEDARQTRRSTTLSFGSASVTVA